MNRERLEQRIERRAPSWLFACLGGWQLRFNKKSIDNSGKANIVNEQGEVFGVIFDITDIELKKLTKHETGYEQASVTLHAPTVDKQLDAITFIATKSDEDLRPTSEYLRLIIQGASEHCLPIAYIQKLTNFKTVDE